MMFPSPSSSSSSSRLRNKLPSSSSSSASSLHWKCGTQHIAMAALCLSLAYGALSWHFLTRTATQQQQQQQQQSDENKQQPLRVTSSVQADKRAPQQHSTNANAANLAAAAASSTTSTCPFRRYPPHRYYDLNNPQQPDFLTTSTEYIHGTWPRILPDTTPSVKLCVDQTSWRPQSPSDTLPFADGTNPSLLSVARLKKIQQEQKSSSLLSQLLEKLPPTVAWIATVCMTNSQCTWKDTPEQVQQFHLSKQDKPDTVQTVLLLLDENFAVVQQSTIRLHINQDWGKRVKYKPQQSDRHQVMALDDARLFVHDGAVWISYREGPGFGYESQVLNPLHFAWNTDSTAATLDVTIVASETSFFCCGRNMALMENLQNPAQLMSLTWVDPVTVESVNTTAQPVPPPPKKRQMNNQHGRRLTSEQHAFFLSPTAHRRLGSTKKKKPHKSHIHGTNAFMLYIPTANVFLGVAHFHRPNDRQSNPFARFGHHYTHAFYTVSAGPPFELKGLSAEFVYAGTAAATDAEIIQFSSGLELSPDGQSIVLAYGINDCEAAVTTVPWSTVQSWLQPVQPGQQVVDFMRPLANT